MKYTKEIRPVPASGDSDSWHCFYVLIAPKDGSYFTVDTVERNKRRLLLFLKDNGPIKQDLIFVSYAMLMYATCKRKTKVVLTLSRESMLSD